ncbi:putative SRF-type transcription factor [Ordospora pajunii]|uniref:putative SRF-type transcription factor n=1 Tax=Ordospora pajunii TaxID=3039483 RepID=UPI0029527B6F|nr:putative SRF-type transcription factor [Ordospora pajunii]KAH9411076.1 putative SRF-type transcription factor [Ordospora pajunii]
MEEDRKHGKKEEQEGSQVGAEMDYGIPLFGMNENIPEGFPYPSWGAQGMNYAFDHQYNYYNHHPISSAPFQGSGMPTSAQGFEQNNMSSSITFEKPRGRSHGKKKIKLEYIAGKNKRSVCFSKRKRGIMKKAYELNILTGTEILLLIASESGHVFTFATDKLKPIILEHENIIQSCLNKSEGVAFNGSMRSERNRKYSKKDIGYDDIGIYDESSES